MPKHSGTVRTTRRRLQLVDIPHPLSDSLARLATVLDEAAEDSGWGAPPALIRITSWPANPDVGFDLGIRPLDREANVVDALAGFTAPADWMAIGVVTEGNARHLVDPTIERRRVRCVHLVDRTGASASALRFQGDDATVLDGTTAPEGRIDDVCRRALGLGTAPPWRGSTLELWAIEWLGRILEWCGRDPSAVLWSDIATLHPAAAVLVADDDRWERRAADNLVRLGELMAQVNTWDVLRTSCAAGEWPTDEVPDAVAAWLDEGAFSRWVLGGFPPLQQLAPVVLDLLPPSLRRRVKAALRAWSLDWEPPA